MTVKTTSATVAVLFTLACGLASAGQEPKDSAASEGRALEALRAARIVTGTGAAFENGVVLIRGGKIEAAGANLPVPAGYAVTDFGPAVIAPGFVDIDTALGALGENSEPAETLQPAAAAERVFDRFHEDFGRALAAGITSALITPSAENVVGGTAAAVKTAGSGAFERIIRTGGPLVLTVSESALRSDRPPTSRAGAIDLLRRSLEAARAGAGDAASHPQLQAFASGRLDGLFRADASFDLATALALQQEFGLKIALVGASEAWKCMDALGRAGLPIVLGACDLSAPDRRLAVPGRLARAGLKVAFATGAPAENPGLLRVTAALAVRHGMPEHAALKALTLNPAEIAGIGHRVGSIAAGKDADLAVFSGNPLDLSSRLLCVYVDGGLAFAASRRPGDAEKEVR